MAVHLETFKVILCTGEDQPAVIPTRKPDVSACGHSQATARPEIISQQLSLSVQGI